MSAGLCWQRMALMRASDLMSDGCLSALRWKALHKPLVQAHFTSCLLKPFMIADYTFLFICVQLHGDLFELLIPLGGPSIP